MGQGRREGIVSDIRIIELTEYEPKELDIGALTSEEGEAIWSAQSHRVSVEPPSFRTNNKWRLTSSGWVGYIPIHSQLGLSLRPRVSLSNLFRMLEYACNLKSFEIFEGLSDCASLQEFYERLANILARRVLDRARRGLYRSYIEWDERLTCIRGRIDMRHALGRPWDPTLRCHFEEHTADIEENQILVHTLSTVARSGLCTERVLPTVRQGYRAVRGVASRGQVTRATCLGRLYNRLNDDYQPMHALCRFFLEHAGPSFEAGDHQMIPFVVSMPQLFESFVAEWLKVHVDGQYEVKAQYSLDLGGDDEFNIRVDLIVREKDTGRIVAVLDTKYKKPDKPSQADISQIVTYALANDCPEGILVYPKPLHHHVDLQIQNVHVRSLHFDLGGELEEAGMGLINELFEGLGGGRV